MLNFHPTFTFESVLSIPAEILKDKKLIILDIDNTLCYPESTISKPAIITWIKKLRKSHKVIFLSNSHTIRQRKETLEKLFDCEFHISNYKKPSDKLVKEFKDNYNLNSNNGLIIGDMRFTDIIFGNKLGIETILVKPLGKEKLIRISIARHIENILAKLLKK